VHRSVEQVSLYCRIVGKTMISRDWHCQNDRCGHKFHSYAQDNPPCPRCGCVRVGWVPGGGHIMVMAPRMDKRLRSIADQHGLTNLNSPSPSRLNRAAPRAPVYQQVQGYNHHWGLGVSSPISTQGAICVQSSTPVDIRGKVPIGVARDRSASFPGPEANAIVVARTRGV